jgi:hypothetical protein
MVEIFDIVVDDIENTISCSYSPENSGLCGTIVINTLSGEVINIEFSQYEYGKEMYVALVKSKLIELFKSDKPMPNRATAMCF